MGASYERINSRAGMELLFLRAKAIRIQEHSFSRAKMKSQDLFPQFLQVLVPEGVTTLSSAATHNA